MGSIADRLGSILVLGAAFLFMPANFLAWHRSNRIGRTCNNQ